MQIRIKFNINHRCWTLFENLMQMIPKLLFLYFGTEISYDLNIQLRRNCSPFFSPNEHTTDLIDIMINTRLNTHWNLVRSSWSYSIQDLSGWHLCFLEQWCISSIMGFSIFSLRIWRFLSGNFKGSWILNWTSTSYQWKGNFWQRFKAWHWLLLLMTTNNQLLTMSVKLLCKKMDLTTQQSFCSILRCIVKTVSKELLNIRAKLLEQRTHPGCGST